MKKKVTIALLAVVATATAMIAAQSGAFSVRELLGLGGAGNQAATTAVGKAGAPEATVAQSWGTPSEAADDGKLTLEEIQQILANVDRRQRSALLADEEAFHQFVRQEADNDSVLAAARANNLTQDANTVFLMQRGAENILREAYLERLISSKLPDDFPTDAQVTEYFEKNRDKFVVGERLHVWQIFLSIPQDADAKRIAQIEKQAGNIAADLKQGKIDFAAAAFQYSDHEASRNNGGYLGLVKVSELKPDISKPLLSLEEGKLSAPVRSAEGMHILMRGARVPAQELNLDQIKPQVRQLLTNQARAQLRKAIFDQARETYPVDIKDAKIEEWRLRLRTNLDSQSVGSAPAGKE